MEQRTLNDVRSDEVKVQKFKAFLFSCTEDRKGNEREKTETMKLVLAVLTVWSDHERRNGMMQVSIFQKTLEQMRIF